MSRYTVFWLMPSIPAVSFTENAKRDNFPSPSALWLRACGGVFAARLATSNCCSNCCQSSCEMVNVLVMVIVHGFFRLLFIRGK